MEGEKCLTMAGRMELVKSVVQGMLVYTMLVYKWPVNLVHKLDTRATQAGYESKEFYLYW